MERKDVWLDCDPGHDDMFAIILAALHENINLLGISTSAGNSTIQNTTQNALNILEEIEKTDISVYMGSSSPLCAELNVAHDIHGASGLEGAILKVSKKVPIVEDSLHLVSQKIISHETEVHFVVTGAMTNLAIMIKANPQILKKIKTITIMGGAIGLGNWSPAAEFNILVDPEAAQIVFNCGIKIVMIPLEVTHQVLVNQVIFNQIFELKTEFSKKLYDLLKFFQIKYKENQNFDFPVVHDPCTIFYLLHPELFSGRDSYVEIELLGKSRGRTNCHFMHLKHEPNAFVCEKMKVQSFWQEMMTVIKSIK